MEIIKEYFVENKTHTPTHLLLYIYKELIETTRLKTDIKKILTRLDSCFGLFKIMLNAAYNMW